ncbi:MAG: hypothetical protein KDE19_19895 [Caldilineaceae bacterium]|nr:hypothetical protein [Caldilineaceae bacterium]
MAEMAKLYELQKIDVMSTKIRRRLLQLKDLLTESNELKQMQAKIDDLATEHEKWQHEQTKAETELQSLSNRIKESSAALMRGDIHNPKELESLQASVEAMERQREHVESGSVEALYKAEEVAGQLAEAQTNFASMQEDWSSSQTELNEEDTKLKRAYLHLKKQREQVATEINDALVQRYEQMRKRKGGIAVATIENDTCGACHVQLPTGVISTLRNQQKETQVLCPTCGRLLFVP